MVQMFVHHRVGDYAKWRAVFDSAEAQRRQFGSLGAQVLRNAADGNEVVVLDRYPTLEQAHIWAQSDVLRGAVKEAGVTSQPEMLFLEEA